MTLKRSLLAATAIALFTSFAATAQAGEYERGLDAFKKREYAEAVSIWTPLAEQGHAGAQYNLARMYDTGTGVAEDDAKAVLWYKRAAEQDFVPAIRELAMSYVDGEGVAVNGGKAVELLEESAAAGDAESEFQLGMLYREGKVIGKDYAEAMKWYLTAAAQGHSEAQYMIGFMYGSGYGVPQDFVMAYYYYTLASEEIDISIPAREHLAEYMTSDELTRAMSLVSEQRTVASTGQSLTTTTTNP